MISYAGYAQACLFYFLRILLEVLKMVTTEVAHGR